MVPGESKPTATRILQRAVVAAVLVVVWAAASEAARSALFPGPLEVARSLVASARGGMLGRAVVVSALRLSFGYLLALTLGVPLGVVLARVPALKRALGPLLLGLSSVPSICWLPLAIVWFGLSEAAIQVVVVLGAALPITLATESSVRQLPPSIERAARTMGARGFTLLFRVLLAAALPGILTGAKMGWTFALRSLMAGELLFVSGGLGQLLETGRDLADTALVLGVVVVIVVLSRASERVLFGPVERLVARRWGTAAP
ncbi:MAG: ABC transporter permease subunit [Labilithrix sp.]|nr:ABC transporter permease subunit [Labilithrix sp.]MCW5814488.1 ABC transporter permease subunit [Labilithrix sp.]